MNLHSTLVRGRGNNFEQVSVLSHLLLILAIIIIVIIIIVKLNGLGSSSVQLPNSFFITQTVIPSTPV